jgi:hypothetical protein
MASPMAEYVVLLGKNGRIASRGTVSDALKKDETLAKELAEGVRAIKDDEKKIDSDEPDEVSKVTDGKLILAEEITEGHVSWDASEHAILFRISVSETHCCPNEVKLFINGLGGTHPVLFWVLFVGGLMLSETFLTVQTWFVGYWAEQYDIYPPEQVNITL